jgi:hypothetical protein
LKLLIIFYKTLENIKYFGIQRDVGGLGEKGGWDVTKVKRAGIVQSV